MTFLCTRQILNQLEVVEGYKVFGVQTIGGQFDPDYGLKSKSEFMSQSTQHEQNHSDFQKQNNISIILQPASVIL